MVVLVRSQDSGVTCCFGFQRHQQGQKNQKPVCTGADVYSGASGDKEGQNKMKMPRGDTGRFLWEGPENLHPTLCDLSIKAERLRGPPCHFR